MTIKLVENWPAILRRAYSVWLAALASAAALVEVIHADIVALLPLLAPYLSDSQGAKLAAVCTALLPLARIVKQVAVEVDK